VSIVFSGKFYMPSEENCEKMPAEIKTEVGLF